jgi:hypothetical protein
VPSLDFGGITDCEGGGGWVSRTPFLPELRIMGPPKPNGLSLCGTASRMGLRPDEKHYRID